METSVVFLTTKNTNIYAVIYAIVTVLSLLLTGCQTTKALTQQKQVYLLIDTSKSALSQPNYKAVVQQTCNSAVKSMGFGLAVTTFVFADKAELVDQSEAHNRIEQRRICNHLPKLIERRQIGKKDGTSLVKVLNAVRVKLDRSRANEIVVLLDRNESPDAGQIVPTIKKILPNIQSLKLTIADYQLQQQLDEAVHHRAFKTCPFNPHSTC